MDLLSTLRLAAVGFLAAAALASPPPGRIIDTSPDPRTTFVGSPSIVVRADGSYVASHDWFGTGALRGRTVVFISADRGTNWRETGTVADQHFSTLFTHRGALYLIGTSSVRGDILIRRSGDGGASWTEPDGAKGGVLLPGHFDCGATPVIEANGRVWRAFEESPGGKSRVFRAFMFSAPAEADLLQAANWTRTNAIALTHAWLAVKTPSWLEGNAVQAPGGGIVDLLRIESHPGAADAFALGGGATGIPRFEVAAMLTVSADSRVLSFDPGHGFIHFVGSESKFTIRYDPLTRRYWSLGNKITRVHDGADWVHSPHHQRNVVELTSSADLRDWREEYRLISYAAGSDVTKAGSHEGFQYLDWQFDGPDIIAVCRTAWAGLDYHDANLLTFHRIRDFRHVTMADSPAPLPLNPAPTL